MDGFEERVIPGGALSVHPSLPYQGLEQFGVSFLNRLEGIQLPSKILNNLTFIDTPGVLSGEKQSVSRGYNFVKVCSWFANHSDLIILLFDAHKLDISDEFKDVLQGLFDNREKIRCVLNKADQVLLSLLLLLLSPPSLYLPISFLVSLSNSLLTRLHILVILC